VASWALTAALVFGGLGIAVDGGVVLFSGHTARIALANALTAGAFGTWAALAVAPLVTLAAGAFRFLDARGRGLWVLPTGALAYWTAVTVSINGVTHAAIVVRPPPALEVYAGRIAFALGIVLAAVP
jgi:hypothetical protein